MGQAFRRATGRIPPAARKPTSTVDRKPPVPPNEDMKVARKVEFDSGDQSGEHLHYLLYSVYVYVK